MNTRVAGSERGWFALGLAAFVLYAFASVVPRGDTWGLHAFAYLPWWARLAGLGVCFALICPPRRWAVAGVTRITRPLLDDGLAGNLLLAGIGLGAFLAFEHFAIRTEVYGDTRTILRHWTDNRAISSTWLGSLLDFRLQHNDAALTEVLLRTVAQTFSVPIELAFRVTSALSGALSLCLWTLFVRGVFRGSVWAPLLLVGGFTLGASQIFFGHVETYAFVFLPMLMLWITGYLALEGKASPWLVGLLFVFALRAHAAAICFVPALAYVMATAAVRRPRGADASVPGRAVWAWIVVPALALAALLYLFHFRALAAPYLGTATTPPPTFLPLLPGPGPWNYALLSPAHLLDLANVLALVGMPVLLVLLGLILLHGRAIRWQDPTLVYATLGLAFPLAFFVAVNPLLSLPRDWDLVALLGVPLLLFLAAVLARSDESRVPMVEPTGLAMGFAVFTVGFWALNCSPAALSPRLEQVGEHVFRTYHASASYLIGSAQGMDPDTTRSIARRIATIERLTPATVPGDEEYTHLLMMLATVYRARGDTAHAVEWVDRASEAAPMDANLGLFRADFLLWANQPGEATAGLRAILARDPRNFDALVLAAGAAAAEGDYAAALDDLARAGTVHPDDPDVAAWTANVRKRQERAAAAGGPASAGQP